MTGDRLAEEAGMLRSSLSQLETGSRRANVENLIEIAQALGVHPGDLFRHPKDKSFEMMALFDQISDDKREQVVRVLGTFLDPDAVEG